MLESRRSIVLKLCRHIRQNNYQMIKAKNYSERPYCDGEKKYKFNTANYLRLLATERNYKDPRWYTVEDIQQKHWSLKENATPELLEDIKYTPAGGSEYFLREFFNAEDLKEVEPLQIENQPLEEVLDFLIVREILEKNGEIISLQEGIDAVKYYAAQFFQDELIQILTAQMWLVETKVTTKMSLFLPTYPEEILLELEKMPEIIFDKMKQASAILKRLRQEKVKQVAEDAELDDLFQDLKIIYHGSEVSIKDKFGWVYAEESILTGVTAYEFLNALHSQAENFKIWLEFSYKDYEHGKFLMTNSNGNLISELMKKRLNKNRRELLKNPQSLPQFILSCTDQLIPNEKILERIKKETETFQIVISDFEIEEKKYFDSHSAN